MLRQDYRNGVARGLRCPIPPLDIKGDKVHRRLSRGKVANESSVAGRNVFLLELRRSEVEMNLCLNNKWARIAY